MVFRNKNFTKRDYEATNIVACVSEKQPNTVGWIPNDAWIPTDESVLNGLTHMGDIRYQINLTADEALWSVVSIMTNTGFGYLKTNSQHDADKEKFGSAFTADARAILGFDV